MIMSFHKHKHKKLLSIICLVICFMIICNSFYIQPAYAILPFTPLFASGAMTLMDVVAGSLLAGGAIGGAYYLSKNDTYDIVSSLYSSCNSAGRAVIEGIGNAKDAAVYKTAELLGYLNILYQLMPASLSVKTSTSDTNFPLATSEVTKEDLIAMGFVSSALDLISNDLGKSILIDYSSSVENSVYNVIVNYTGEDVPSGYVYDVNCRDGYDIYIAADNFRNALIVGSSKLQYPNTTFDTTIQLAKCPHILSEHSNLFNIPIADGGVISTIAAYSAVAKPATKSICPDLTLKSATTYPDNTWSDGTVKKKEVAFPIPGSDVITLNPDIAGTGTGDLVIDGSGTVNPPIDPPVDGGILQNLWDWLKGILQSILDAIGDIPAALSTILATIIGLPAQLIELAKTLVITLAVPADGYFSSKFDSLLNAIKAKTGPGLALAFINVGEQSLDDITITIYGQTVTIVSFEWLIRYRDTFRAWITGFVGVLMIIYNFSQIYRVIRGHNYVEAQGRSNGKE